MNPRIVLVSPTVAALVFVLGIPTRVSARDDEAEAQRAPTLLAIRLADRFLALPMTDRMVTTVTAGAKDVPRLQDVLDAITACRAKAVEMDDANVRSFSLGATSVTPAQSFQLCEQLRARVLAAPLHQCEQLRARLKSRFKDGQWTPVTAAKISDWFVGDCVFTQPTENKPASFTDKQGQSLKKFCQDSSFGADELREQQASEGLVRLAALRCEKTRTTTSGEKTELGKASAPDADCAPCRKWSATSGQGMPALDRIVDAARKLLAASPGGTRNDPEADDE